MNETIINQIIIFLLELILFIFIIKMGDIFSPSFKNRRLLNHEEYLPKDEIHNLKQLFYLIIMALCFINALYCIVLGNSDLFYFAIFDIILSLYCCFNIDKSSMKNKILLLFIMPFDSLSFLLFGHMALGILDIVHIIGFIYLIKYYYNKFNEYTANNGLGISILLLFSIIFISVFVTGYFENVDLLDGLVMSSNAFTSNGYTILGKSIVGKIDSLFLVWGGYIISGAGTATLTAGILMRYFNKKFEKLEELIKEEKK